MLGPAGPLGPHGPPGTTPTPGTTRTPGTTPTPGTTRTPGDHTDLGDRQAPHDRFGPGPAGRRQESRECSCRGTRCPPRPELFVPGEHAARRGPSPQNAKSDAFPRTPFTDRWLYPAFVTSDLSFDCFFAQWGLRTRRPGTPGPTLGGFPLGLGGASDRLGGRVTDAEVIRELVGTSPVDSLDRVSPGSSVARRRLISHPARPESCCRVWPCRELAACSCSGRRAARRCR